MFKNSCYSWAGEQIATINSDTVLWHKKIGHMSKKGMKVLRSKKVLPSLKCVNMDFYESCVYRKQKRVSFVKSGKEKKDEKLDLVHTISGIFPWWLSLLCYIY